MKTIPSDVIDCPECKGRGGYYQRHGADAVHWEWFFCTTCGGAGSIPQPRKGATR